MELFFRQSCGIVFRSNEFDRSIIPASFVTMLRVQCAQRSLCSFQRTGTAPDAGLSQDDPDATLAREGLPPAHMARTALFSQS